jgi:hypothetical protein
MPLAVTDSSSDQVAIRVYLRNDQQNGFRWCFPDKAIGAIGPEEAVNYPWSDLDSMKIQQISANRQPLLQQPGQKAIALIRQD